MQIVKVCYLKTEANAYAGRAYTYRTTLPLKAGDKVLAPTDKDPAQKALVIQVGLPESVIDPAWADRVKTITQYDTEVAK